MSNPNKNRDDLRAALLSSANKTPDRKRVTFFGQEVDIVQPSIEAVLDAREEGSPVERSIGMLINYACVPDSEERIFERADIAFLRQLPWGPDFVRLNQVIAELTGVDLSEAKEQLQSPLSSQATE